MPSSAPEGAYIYRGYIGQYPTKWDSSSFTFTKLSTGDSPVISDWSNTGEPFPGEEITQTDLHPSSFSLHPCSPNPFNPSTVASYELRVPSQVSLRVYDTAGRVVATLVEGWQEAGTHSATFDPIGAGGSKLAAGVYLVRMEAGGEVQVSKIVLLK